VQFYNLQNELNIELDELISTGYSGEGFYSQGKQLGSSRPVTKSEARTKALEAAEKRQRLGKLMLPAGGRRLGGGESAAEREVQFTPQELAAQAAERRRRDNIWCGGQEAITQEAKPEDYVSTFQDSSSGTTSTKRRLDDVDDKAWACGYCTFMNEPLHLVCSMCLQEKTKDKRIKSS
jgi:DNA-dependent metalloprotease WSS1